MAHLPSLRWTDADRLLGVAAYFESGVWRVESIYKCGEWRVESGVMDEIPASGISLIKIMCYAVCLMLCVMQHYKAKLVNASR